MASDFDILRIQVFSDLGTDSGAVMENVEKDVNSYLSTLPADRVVSIQSQIADFVDPHWDIDGAEVVTRCSITITHKA